jgi:TolB-like protein
LSLAPAGRPQYRGRLALLASAAVVVGASACRVPGGGATPPSPLPDAASAAAIRAERGAGRAADGALGVLPFRVGGSSPQLTALGFAVADLLATDLSRSGRLRLVERARLGEVLQELDLARAGTTDSASAPRVGRLVSAQRLVLGSLDSLPQGEFRVGVRLADVSSGTIDQVIDARAPIGDILSAEKVLAFRIFEALGIDLTPAERALVEIRHTGNLEALAAYGRGVQAELSGDRRRALDEFRRASALDPAFGLAGTRGAGLRAEAQRRPPAPVLLPGVRSIDTPVSGTIDRLNRPLDVITTFTRPTGGPSDPAFPSTVVTVLITVKRP